MQIQKLILLNYHNNYVTFKLLVQIFYKIFYNICFLHNFDGRVSYVTILMF